MFALYENRDDKARAKLDADLLTPPAGEDVDVAGTAWDPAAELAAFKAAAGAQSSLGG